MLVLMPRCARVKTATLHETIGDHLQPRVDDVDNAESLDNGAADHP